jgi:hypothetical protein
MTHDPAAWVAGLSDDELARVARTYRRLYGDAVLAAAEAEAERRGVWLEPLDDDDYADDDFDVPTLRPSVQMLAFAAIGALLTGQFAYSVRPTLPGVTTQLPWRTVLHRAGDLHDPGPIIVLLAQVSFNYVVLGMIIGALLGALGACFLLWGRRRAAEAAARARAPAVRLVRLAELRRDGAITAEEYAARKAEIVRRL